MKSKHLLIIAVVFAVAMQTLNAQVTIGSQEPPHPDALLDLKSTTDGSLSAKGLLLPRVRLSALTNPSPLVQHVEGMIVYNIDETNVKAGLYYNNGSSWVNIDPLAGGKVNQALVSGADLQPAWGVLDFPDAGSIGFVMKKFAVSNNSTGKVFIRDSGYEVTVENYQYGTAANDWFKLQMQTPFSVRPQHSKNRLIVTMQTIVQSNNHASNVIYNKGWAEYAGGVFINDLLKVVKLNQFSYSGTFPFDTMTMYLIVEDLPVNVDQAVDIGVVRLKTRSEELNLPEQIAIGVPSSDPGIDNLNNFMAKPFISIQYYEDPNSPTN